MALTAAELVKYNNVGGGMPSAPQLGTVLNGLGGNPSSVALPSGAAPAIDFDASEIYTGTLTANTVPTLANPVLDKVILLIISGNFTLTLPGTVTTVGGGVYDGAATNYIYLHCTDASTPAYIATISQP